MDATVPTVAVQATALLHELSRAERQVARALLADYPSAGLSTVAGLAEQAKVSAPTVLRFAQRLGFGGFTELQVALREELTHRSSGPLARLLATAEAGSTLDILVRRARDQAEGTVASLTRIPASSLDAAVELLADTSKRILLTGGRFSYLVAYHLGLHLEQIRPGVRLLDAPQGAGLGSLIDLSRRDVLVLCDFHRFQRSAQEIALAAKRKGTPIIVITDELASPVAPHAEVVLAVSSDAASPYKSMTAAFLLTELLIPFVMERLGEPARTRLALWDRTRNHELLP
ncbi:MurR/RpiR family transcriptional regulator [Luethyella okanaganae]|uniref:MurR/RpiR family transcriptional regulator n=1 Tax=Luethyella okanaganae TaxID=69372 RepID=A0ABW1VIZ1_9MICO